jgi:hypothetical protein
VHGALVVVERQRGARRLAARNQVSLSLERLLEDLAADVTGPVLAKDGPLEAALGGSVTPTSMTPVA